MQVELSDETPAEGSALAATSVCGQIARCASVTIICSGGGDGSCGVGSDGPAHVELSGKTPAEGSALAATAICSQVARCGTVRILCSGGSDGTTTNADCTATITPETHASCYEDVRPDIEQLLSCPGLMAAQIDTIELCVNALARASCLTQAQADALAAQVESGVVVDLDPPECAFLNDPNWAPGC